MDTDFQFCIKPISWCRISGQLAVCTWFSLQFHLPCQMSSLLLLWWIGIILWPWFWTEINVALTMITQNLLSRKQHSSGNRKGQIILSYNWKAQRVTLYPAVSQFSSGDLWASCLYTWHKLREGREDGRKRQMRARMEEFSAPLSMVKNSEAGQALAAVESGQGSPHPPIAYWELLGKEWAILLPSWMFSIILAFTIRKVHMYVRT